MEIDQTRIEDAIVRDVADRIIGDDEIYHRVKTVVDARIDAIFSNSVDAQIKTAIEAAISQGFEREYTRVDTFGQRTGSTTTIRAELVKMISGYWNEKVDKQGKPSTYSNVTRAEWLMTKMVAADFQGEMQQHVVNIGSVLRDTLRAELHGTVNRLLAEVIHVNSANRPPQAPRRKRPA